MKYREQPSSYDKYPVIPVPNYQGHGWYDSASILETLSLALRQKEGAEGRADNVVLAVDTYPGVRDEELLPMFEELKPDCLVDMRDCFLAQEAIEEKLKDYLTEDRVFGKMYFGELTDFWDREACQKELGRIRQANGLTLVYGFGAAELFKGSLVVYCDMNRWEIQLRYRAGMANYKAGNETEDILKKIKRGYFVEWRTADKQKRRLMGQIDFYLDSTLSGNPKMISGEALRDSLRQTVNRPFRTVPYFDPGVWGGQWMKEVCGLDSTRENFAWSFDGVPEENSLIFDYVAGQVQVPAMNLVLTQPTALLGEQVYARFGAEFPIRFDFLDTMQGQNLSLQVHPVTDYIHTQFGMNYTQDESYYILDARGDACVYLGTTEDADPGEMFADLEEAQAGGRPFDAERYVNCYPAHKHDHFLIPAGTIHCAGGDCMVLEISATPYIFTFKLWDWGRLGLDGKPRPIHIAHGTNVIQWDRRTKWVDDNLVNQVYTIHENDSYKEEHTGLHKLEFIETRRYWIKDCCDLNTSGTVNMLNLIEGNSAVVESRSGAFAPFTVHYAETFIIPAAVGEYTIRPMAGETIGVIRAYVRGG